MIAVIDYGMGNLFSIKHACESVGLRANITSLKQEILSADGIILPGVGAFGDAIESLKRLDLIQILREIAASHKPVLAICLGMQLLMDESCEFGFHKGLGIINGEVVSFKRSRGSSNHRIKVPHVGWNRIYMKKENLNDHLWDNSLLSGLPNYDFMYFIHSYYVVPADNKKIILSMSQYEDVEFCSSIQYKNIFACQFHPERSGVHGLKIYRNLRYWIENKKGQNEKCCDSETRS